MIELVQQLTNKNLKVAELVEEEEEEEGEEEESRGRCERHQQVLSLFCKDDLELLCTQSCCSSQAEAQELPGKAGEAAEGGRNDLRKPGVGEENVLQNRLSRQMAGFSKKIIDGQTQLSDVGSNLKSLLRDILGLQLQTDLTLLRGAGHMLRQWRQWGGLELTPTFPYQYVEPALLLPVTGLHNLKDLHLAWRQRQSLGFPEAPSWEHKRESPSLPPSYIGLDNMRAKFQVHLTLDSETAHPELLISHQTTSNYCQEGAQPSPGMRPRAFTSHVAVLGVPGFGGGRHFWQVQIRGLGVWCLGVCTEAFSRDTRAAQTPRNGCWQVPLTVSLSLPHLPQGKAAVACFRVFLDYELGEISFYNMSKKTHLLPQMPRAALEPLPVMNISSCDGLWIMGSCNKILAQWAVGFCMKLS
ncbi:tripartite motif-containing protein 75-like [Suncus etruscus]|uniref:tripartite motif-containing protein 75-like n=1 Tax=Suncus etruscus TaxID=109475 RepID=UPI00210FCE41|nr:tripartite motif-containing protein 75-like [Suncus etruscus]